MPKRSVTLLRNTHWQNKITSPITRFSVDENMVVFRNRLASAALPQQEVNYPRLDPEAYHFAKQVAPRYDVYALEQEWRDWWVEMGMPELHSAGKAFVGFCKARNQRAPNP